jgi:alkaline phosphatase D
MALSRRDLLKVSAVTLASCGVATKVGKVEDTAPTSETPSETPVAQPPAEKPPAENPPAEQPPVQNPPGNVDISTLTEAFDAFPIGVAAGDVFPESVILWTRTAESTGLSVRVWRESDPKTYVFAQAVTQAGGFVHIEATGLQPNTAYYYAFTLSDKTRSMIGRFRTAPAADSLEVVTFAGGCCTHSRGAPYPALSEAAKRDDLQFFVHGGDQVYCDGATELADYQATYDEIFAEKGMREVAAAHACFNTWDDHEVTNNFNPETIDAAQFAAARKTFFDFHAMRRDQTDPDRIWRSRRFGKTLELFVLDARGERIPTTRTSADPIYLSRAQMDWLKQSLKTSSAQFKCIVNQVPMARFGGLFALAADDRWEGYAAQRKEILDFILSENITGVWWLSGDFHFGTSGTLEKSGPYAGMREVLWGPSGQRPNPLYPLIDMDQWDFSTGENNFAVLKADPVKNEMTVTFIDGKGETIFEKTYPNT